MVPKPWDLHSSRAPGWRRTFRAAVWVQAKIPRLYGLLASFTDAGEDQVPVLSFPTLEVRMSRRIETGLPAAVAAVSAAPSSDDYLGRLLKYIPAEIVGFYLVAAGLISPKPDTPNFTGLWVVFALGFILVPIYFWIATSRDQGKGPLRSQIVLATIAYPVWVFAIGGPFVSFSWYRTLVASIVLVFVTVLFGMYKPEPGR